MKKLTKMQQKVYDYIAQFMTKWGYPPSVREICAELNFKSPSTAHFHILNLEKKGYLEHDAGRICSLLSDNLLYIYPLTNK